MYRIGYVIVWFLPQGRAAAVPPALPSCPPQTTLYICYKREGEAGVSKGVLEANVKVGMYEGE